MAKDYQQLWKGVADATDKTEAVRTLADIVADVDGRTFALGLELEGVRLCIETLDSVGRNLCLPLSLSQMVSSGHRRTQPRNTQEAYFLRRVEKTRRAS